MPYNIEKHPRLKGVYIVYSPLDTWRITKTESGSWQANGRDKRRYVVAKTLELLGEEINKY